MHCYAECCYAECRYAECHYVEYRYAECCYAEGLGAHLTAMINPEQPKDMDKMWIGAKTSGQGPML
jgi:hypothetical protein